MFESNPFHTRYRVEYLMPGSFMSEPMVKPISAYSVKEAVDAAPDDAFCFTIYEVEETPDLGPDFLVLPKPKNRSVKHYIGGTVLSVDAVEAMEGDYAILVANMRGNGWDFVVRCRTGNFQPYAPGDVMVAPRVCKQGSSTRLQQ